MDHHGQDPERAAVVRRLDLAVQGHFWGGNKVGKLNWGIVEMFKATSRISTLFVKDERFFE